MLTLIYGIDQATREKNKESVLIQLEKKGGVYTRLVYSDVDATEEILTALISGSSMFGDIYIVELNHLLTNEELSLWLLKNVKALAESPHQFIVNESEKLTKDIVSRFEKAGADIYFVETKKEVKKESPLIFTLADSFLARDKKGLWMLYRDALESGSDPREIVGILFWVIKNMSLVASANTGDSGLSPFVYTKTKRGLEAWKDTDLRQLSRELVELYHRAQFGELDFEIGVEHFLLTRV